MKESRYLRVKHRRPEVRPQTNLVVKEKPLNIYAKEGVMCHCSPLTGTEKERRSTNGPEAMLTFSMRFLWLAAIAAVGDGHRSKP